MLEARRPTAASLSLWRSAASASLRSKAPTLIIAGDHDPYNQTEKMVELYRLLADGELAIVPGCGHVVLDCKGQFTIGAVKDFLIKGER
jgi:pimeloyl-ACP methyl ester carboxylesterase